jgi:hypothetical protein
LSLLRARRVERQDYKSTIVLTTEILGAEGASSQALQTFAYCKQFAER